MLHEGGTGYLKSITDGYGELGSQDLKSQFPQGPGSCHYWLSSLFLVVEKKLCSFSAYQGLRESLGLILPLMPLKPILSLILRGLLWKSNSIGSFLHLKPYGNNFGLQSLTASPSSSSAVCLVTMKLLFSVFFSLPSFLFLFTWRTSYSILLSRMSLPVLIIRWPTLFRLSASPSLSNLFWPTWICAMILIFYCLSKCHSY